MNKNRAKGYLWAIGIAAVCVTVAGMGVACFAAARFASSGMAYISESAEPMMYAHEHQEALKARKELDAGKEPVWNMSKIAMDDVHQGNLVEAADFGNKLLAFADENKADPDKEKSSDRGIAIHVGNNVLGLVALKKGDKQEAKRRMLAAGLTPGSPTLDSFGPNMLLARELYHAGEGDSVIKYLEECKVFDSFNSSEIDGWISAIRNHQEPNFGANIFY